jgi:hypothetical protein
VDASRSLRSIPTMRHLLLASMALSIAACAPSELEPPSAPYDVTVAHGYVGTREGTAVCLDSFCTGPGTRDAQGRTTWERTFRFDRAALERGVRFSLVAADHSLCPSRLVRFEARHFAEGQIDVPCDGPIVRMLLAEAP